MSQHVTYDKTDNVIFCDYTDLVLTKELLEQIGQEIVAVAATLPRPVFSISCWRNARFDPALSEQEYADLTRPLLKITLGMLRYEVTNPFTSIFIRTQNVRNHFQGSNAMIFANRAEALAEVRRREQEKSTKRL